ncbi:hypothetical protein TNIN_465591 [Trichonephila inaurata madagascariensis]|uniref:Uncharacterized protein n=1 Tax=Trichonephila inaurata madagascariensis TaxID=2747483 RepID=A0A8X7C9Q0_9ARAC|nr:hypothetical protein TNIN_465591 [Trichonephila inaurata madagascariensis]
MKLIRRLGCVLWFWHLLSPVDSSPSERIPRSVRGVPSLSFLLSPIPGPMPLLPPSIWVLTTALALLWVERGLSTPLNNNQRFDESLRFAVLMSVRPLDINSDPVRWGLFTVLGLVCYLDTYGIFHELFWKKDSCVLSGFDGC